MLKRVINLLCLSTLGLALYSPQIAAAPKSLSQKFHVDYQNVDGSFYSEILFYDLTEYPAAEVEHRVRGAGTENEYREVLNRDGQPIAKIHFDLFVSMKSVHVVVHTNAKSWVSNEWRKTVTALQIDFSDNDHAMQFVRLVKAGGSEIHFQTEFARGAGDVIVLRARDVWIRMERSVFSAADSDRFSEFLD